MALLLCLIAIAVLQYSQAEDGAIRTSLDPVPLQIPHGTVKDSLGAFLISPICDRAVSAGQPVPVMFGVIYLRTAGEIADELRIWPVVPPADPVNLSWFTVKGPDGKNLRWGGGAIDYPGFGPELAISLRQNSFYGTIADLAEYFEFKEPGVYRITWHYTGRDRGAWTGELISNEILIEIK